ncbi:MAG: hypothetical protein RR623_10275 [Bacilli bacterium]|uniref:hypothetical protein n=1 Tax=Anaerorhabdus sp. TaxID=1872524 RepID=UPI002FC7A701
MELLKTFWWLLLILFVLTLLYFKKIKEEKTIDSNTDYSQENLDGKFHELENGDTWLAFPYQLTQQNKKKFILANVQQNKEFKDEYGYTFIVSKLINVEYYNTVSNYQGVVRKTGNPYVVFKVIPKTESPDASINVTGNNAPINISNGEGTATQTIVNSSFSNKIEEYKDVMINHGILEEDINVVINNPNNEHIKESFLSKYGLELAKISVNVAGFVVNLLKIFQS